MNNTIKTYTKKAITGLLLLSAHQTIMADDMQIYQENNDMQVYQDNNDITFDVSVSVGAQSMLANEYLHDPMTNHTNSKLIWDTDSLAMIGLSGSLHFQERYALNIEYWFSANKSDTKMTDYDWNGYAYAGDNWTDRSIHPDTDVTNAASFDINAEFNTLQLSTTRVSTLVGYKQDTATRKAYGGEAVYSDEGFRDTAGNFPDGLLGISYKQTWKSPYLGFKTDTQLTNRFALHTKFIYSPLSKVETLDRHYLRDIVGTSTHDKTTMYAINLGVNYKITTLLDFGVNYMYQRFDTTTGNLKWNEKGSVVYLHDYVRADLKTSLVSMSLNYRF